MDNLGFTELPGIINLFKDKIAFRERMERLAPLFYKELEYQDLDKFKVNEIKKPFIIKPAVGFSSLGVRKVNTNEEWEEAAASVFSAFWMRLAVSQT